MAYEDDLFLLEVAATTEEYVELRSLDVLRQVGAEVVAAAQFEHDFDSEILAQLEDSDLWRYLTNDLSDTEAQSDLSPGDLVAAAESIFDGHTSKLCGQIDLYKLVRIDTGVILMRTESDPPDQTPSSYLSLRVDLQDVDKGPYVKRRYGGTTPEPLPVEDADRDILFRTVVRLHEVINQLRQDVPPVDPTT